MPTPWPVLAPLLSPPDDAADIGVVKAAVPVWTVVLESKKPEDMALIWMVALVEGSRMKRPEVGMFMMLEGISQTGTI